MPVFIVKLLSNRSAFATVFNSTKLLFSSHARLPKTSNFVQNVRFHSTNDASNGAQSSFSMFQMKKRPIRKKKPQEDDEQIPGVFTVMAYSSAEEYDLERVMSGLRDQDLYEPKYIENNRNALHAVAKYRVGHEPRELFFFREGSVVLWNTTELESSNVLNFLKHYEHERYSESIVQNEAEYMNYKHHTNGSKAVFDASSGDVLLPKEESAVLEKYTFSNAMALSVKLGIWEATLEKYIDSIEFVTEDLKMGKKINMTREDVLRKHGELFALRHLINLSSDLLDTPDFYWDREQLENLYSQLCAYYSIPRRTRVMNEKLNHCVELIELLSTHLSDKHHIRLEWMIIVLIMVEVAFETLHYIERYMH